MTEKQLALALMRAKLINMDRVQAAVRLRTPGKGLARVLVEMDWVASGDILKIDPNAFAGHNSSRTTAPSLPALSSPEEEFSMPAHSPSNADASSGLSTSTVIDGTSASDILSLGLGTAPAMDVSGVVLDAEMQGDGDHVAGTMMRVCNNLLRRAVELGASDVHLEPRSNGLQERFRVDGHLRSGALLPAEVQTPMISRIKIMANLNITETRLSQDGRFRATVSGRRFDFRVSTLPGIHGEKIVMRLLDHSSLVTDLSRLGFVPETHEAFEEMLHRAHGMILVTGPTGSGKSTTLYAALASTLDETKNVVAVEDPVEYELEGVMQCHVHAEIGNTFAARLRSILRQDPDVILVGEIRDGETADIAIRAALTGHLVLSTLHTNSAAAAVTRLQDMGVPSFLLASSLTGVVAQRLVRLICRHCIEPLARDTDEYEIGITELRLKPDTVLYHGAGCDKCNGVGYRGRVAIVELLNVDKTLRRAIMDGADADTLHALAREKGMRTLYQDGVEKVQEGLISADELARVLLGTEEFEIC